MIVAKPCATKLLATNWLTSNSSPALPNPERGNNAVVPETGNQLTVEVGSGLVYAMAVHQGHHNFIGYHYLTNGLKKAQGKLPSIIARHQVKR